MTTLAAKFPAAFVTGASTGLGDAFARMLLAEGVRVWGTARDAARLRGLAGAGEFHPVVLDLREPDAAASAFAQADAASGGFDLVVQNAGYGVFGEFGATDFAAWQAQLEAMVVTTARLSHDAFRRFLARPASRSPGCIVHVSSIAAEFPLPFMAGYNMAKAALSALSESLMFESRGRPVTVIDFRPGDYRTLFNQAVQTNSPAHDAGSDARRRRAWEALEAHCNAGPLPAKAAVDLRRALLRGRSGVVRSGDFFQARVAPALAAVAPASWVRAVTARYYGL